MFRTSKSLLMRLTRAQAYEMLGLRSGAAFPQVEEAYSRLMRQLPAAPTSGDAPEQHKCLALAFNLLRSQQAEVNAEGDANPWFKPPPQGTISQPRWSGLGALGFGNQSAAVEQNPMSTVLIIVLALSLVALYFTRRGVVQDFSSLTGNGSSAPACSVDTRDAQQAMLKSRWTAQDQQRYDQWMANWIEANRAQERALRIERAVHKNGEIHFLAKD